MTTVDVQAIADRLIEHLATPPVPLNSEAAADSVVRWLVANVPGYESFTRESVRVDGDTLHIEGRARLCTVTCTVTYEGEAR